MRAGRRVLRGHEQCEHAENGRLEDEDADPSGPEPPVTAPPPSYRHPHERRSWREGHLAPRGRTLVHADHGRTSRDERDGLLSHVRRRGGTLWLEVDVMIWIFIATAIVASAIVILRRRTNP
jgi:hypothetical protein